MMGFGASTNSQFEQEICRPFYNRKSCHFPLKFGVILEFSTVTFCQRETLVILLENHCFEIFLDHLRKQL